MVQENRHQRDSRRTPKNSGERAGSTEMVRRQNGNGVGVTRGAAGCWRGGGITRRSWARFVRREPAGRAAGAGAPGATSARRPGGGGPRRPCQDPGSGRRAAARRGSRASPHGRARPGAGPPAPGVRGQAPAGIADTENRTTPRLAIQNAGLRRRTERGWRAVTAARRVRISAAGFRGSRRPPRAWRTFAMSLGSAWRIGGRGGAGGSRGPTHRWRAGGTSGGGRRPPGPGGRPTCGWAAIQAGTAGWRWVTRLSAKRWTQHPRGTRAATWVRNWSQSVTRFCGSGPGDHPDDGGSRTA